MDRTQKEAFVADLSTILQSSESIVIGHYRGLTVPEFESLRGNAREDGASVKVAKNRLVRIAVKGTPFEGISDLMTGPTSITTSSDPVTAAKVAQKFAEENDKFVILGGAMGDTILDPAGIKNLASMPSLDELRAKMVGLLVAPATKIATITQEPAAKLARVLAMKVDEAA